MNSPRCLMDQDRSRAITLGAHNENGAWCVVQHRIGYTTEKRSLEAAVAATSDHDQIGGPVPSPLFNLRRSVSPNHKLAHICFAGGLFCLGRQKGPSIPFFGVN